MDWAYLYDGSWEGLLCAVFEAFASKRWPRVVLPGDNAQLAFSDQPVHIVTDPVKAERVERGIVRRMGSPAHNTLWTVFLSGDPDKSTLIYRYIRTGMNKGRGVYQALAHDDINAVDRICYHVSHEAHLLHGFTRFSLMENGVYYARITPKNSVLPLLMPFFADRYTDQPLLVYDASHDLAGVYDLHEWYLVETHGLRLPGLAEEETACRRLWKLFYNTIAIAQRENPKCRRTNMSKRYWGNMTELNSL